MAKPGCTIFNLGSSHISASKFILNEENIVLEKFQLIELGTNSGGEQEWLNAAEIAISELASKWGFKNEANFILPSSIVLSKTLRVPKVETEKQKKVVAFELSQKMPFPLENLLWDFLVIDDDGIEQEILSFAIKPELIEKLTQVIFRSGIIPLRFTPGPALDYCSIKEILEGEEKDSLLINFGAKSTNLTFFSTSGYLLRSLTLGGWHLSDAIASSYGVNHTKAEEIKKNYASEKNNTDASDHALSALHAVHENFMNKYMQEISRSIVTYKRLKKGKMPTQLIITGRTAKCPNLIQSLAQSQTHPIKYFDPFTQISVSDSVDSESRAILPYISSEFLGLANILLLEPKSTPLNLMPAAKLKQLENKKKLPWFLFSAILLSIIPVPWFLNLQVADDQLNQLNIKLNKETNELSNRLDLYEKENANLQVFKAINKTAAEQIIQLESLSKKTFSLQRLLNNLQLSLDQKINQNTWIDRFEFIPQGRNISASSNSTHQGMAARISGRYLVKPNVRLNDMPEESRRLALIEESGQIQESLTKAITSMNQVIDVSKKTFSIEGEGDLYNRQFTHFEFDLQLYLEK